MKISSEKTIEKTKLITLLKTLSPLERKRFSRFVQSPYQNTNPAVIQLFELLKKQFPFDNPKGLGQTYLYKKIYGQEVFKLAKFQNLCSDLYQVLEDFIIDRHLRENGRKRKKVLIEALSSRAYPLFKKETEKLIAQIEQQPLYKDAEDFFLLHELNKNLWDHLETNKYKQQQEELDKACWYLKEFYKASSMEIASENLGRANILNVDINEFSEINTSVDEESLNFILAILIELHKQGASFEKYTNSKSLILNTLDNLKPKYQTNVLIHLINFTIANTIQNNQNYPRETLALYKVGVQRDLFIVNNRMRDIEFVNICMFSFKLGDPSWTWNFIDTHKKYLASEVAVYLIPFVTAYHFLFIGDFKRVIDLLRHVQPKNNLLYLIRIKAMLLRAYFQGVISNHEVFLTPFEYELISFQKLIERNTKNTKKRKTAYLNFFKILRELLRLSLKDKGRQDKFTFLKKDIENTEYLAYKGWLLDSLIEIRTIS